jgi:hypothetical protein
MGTKKPLTVFYSVNQEFMVLELEGSENLRLLVYQVHSNLLHCKKRLADFPGQGEFGT